MTGNKGVFIVVIVAVLAIAAYWFSDQRKATEQPAPTAVSDPQPAPETPPDADATDDAAIETAAPETPAQPVIDARNWVCTTWLDNTGTLTSTGLPNAETCTQWSIRRTPEPE